MLRFTLIDYTNNLAGVSTVIPEPVGWDSVTMRLKRDKTWHGFFDFIDDGFSDSGLQFAGAARTILGNAYDLKGVEAYVELLVEFKCSDTSAWEELYLGALNFSRYKNVCGDDCWIETGIENTSCILTFKNRYDQKVDLDALSPFDNICADVEEEETAGAVGEFTAPNTLVFLGETPGLLPGKQFTVSGTGSNDGTYTVESMTYDSLLAQTTIVIVEDTFTNEGPGLFSITGCLTLLELVPYSGLDKQIILPGKKIEFKNDWGIQADEFNYTDDLLDAVVIGTTGHYFFPFDWTINRLTEINNSDRTRIPFTTLIAPPAPEFFNQSDGVIKMDFDSALKCIGNTAIEIEMLGEIEVESNDSISFTGIIALAIGNDVDGFSITTLQSGFGCGGCNNVTNAINFSYSTTVNLRQNDRVYLYFSITNFQYLTGGGGGGPSDPFDLRITVDSASLKVTTITECEASKANVYLINETMSRITEAYTNDCLRVYSDYFGRTDAQPYPSAIDGCAGLRSITTGLKIRADSEKNVKIGSTFVKPKVAVSMKDVFDAMNATDNIGMGPEPDPNRPGYELLRVEPVNYFYQDVILMTCDYVKDGVREVVLGELFSILKTGYAKWETENVNGLNDVFGQREYRTILTKVRNTHDRICKFIASDYAIEMTRRKYGATTKDWKYDNDIFIICLSRKPYQYELSGQFYSGGLLILTGDTFDIAEGDTIDITGTTNNNGTFNISFIEPGPFATTIVQLIETTTVPEGPLSFTVTQNPSTLRVEMDNVVSSNNLMHPDTCMNLRISPARNALRHLKTMLMSYRQYINGVLKFTNGDGNYLAQIELDALDNCLLENMNCDSGSGSGAGIGSGSGSASATSLLAEDGDISALSTSCPTQHAPLFRPETIKYEFAVTWREYKTIKANPYGLIFFGCQSVANEIGYIEDFQLKPTGPNGGLATFTLKPKILY